jgi:hypothetical protein
MHMRKYFLTAFVLAASLVFATSGLALEKTAVRMTDDSRAGDWNAGTTCSVAYYNTCTGWVWIWTGWSPNDVLGVCFDNCCLPNHGFVTSNWAFVWTAAPSGYGFTGTISVSDADADCCPAGAIESQVYLPISGWNQYLWNSKISGGSFAVTVQHGPGLGSPLGYSTDHPAAGPTGPQSCGTCFPSPRTAHSFYYGSATTPLCPGSSLNDGVCASEFLWDAQLSCVVSVEEASWGSIKNLYR